VQYVFGDYRLDLQCYELCGAAGVIPLDRQGFAVLAYLVEHRDRVVLRQELFERLWADRFVSDAALEQCVAGIRRAVGDSGRRQRVIQTVHGRGYRFIAPLTAAPSVAGLRADAGPAPEPSPRVQADTSGSPPGERRLLTVLWCALVVPRADAYDPEEFQAWMRTYHQVCTEVIGGLEGYIAHYLSGEVVAYFGYPQAHDEDARRSIRAGLRLREALEARAENGAPGLLTVRVGIHTGLVVMEEQGGDRRERLAIGETPQQAAQLKERAAPGSVVISATTARLVDGYFAWQALTPLSGDVPDAAATAYQILDESTAQSRFDVVRQRGLTPLVGRDAERTLLRERWAQAKDGVGQVLVLRGEAGIGKSRLVHVLREQVAAEPHLWLEWRCTPETHQSPLYPVMAHLHRLLRWRPEAEPAETLHTLEETLTAAGMALAEVVPLFAALLALPLPACYPPLPLTPQRQRQKTLEALLAWLLTEATRQPVLFIVEDVHWCDPSTLDFLTLLLDQGPMARLLTVLTCRPEFVVPWGFRSHLAPLTLSRLPPSQVTQMVGRVAGGHTLPPEVVAQIVAKTDGVPLFVEELTKMVLEAGLLQDGADPVTLPQPLPALAIPDTLHASLLARLDRLGHVKALAQLGATIGRTFDYGLLQRLTPLEEGPLQDGLRHLVDTELVYQRGLPPQATYTFKHALIQDAAYHSLVRSTRQAYHRRIAEVFAADFPETATTRPELLARHYTEAGLDTQAMAYWQQASYRAIERSAYREALHHLSEGAKVLARLPETPARTAHNLALHTTLGRALIVLKGYAAPDVEHAFARALTLCQEIGHTPQFFPAVHGLWGFYVVRAAHTTARALGERCLRLAQGMRSAARLLEAHYALGESLYFLGEVAAARPHFEQGIALYDPQHHRPNGTMDCHVLQDPGVVCHSFLAWILWTLGYPMQALQQSGAALTLAQTLAHPFSLAYALCCAGWLHQLRGEVQETQARAEAAITLATEQAFPLWTAQGMLLRGWALAAQGQHDEALAQMHQGLAAYEATGAVVGRPCFLALLAEVYGKGGRPAEGLPRIAEALELVETTAEGFWEAELHRLRGELLLAGSPDQTGAAEACFHHALNVARHQHAKSLELRAAMSLGRLWYQQGKRTEARDLLAPVYSWFTEGFDTTNLREAQALLEELTCSVRDTAPSLP
jgi:predicted ATPase/DNA-binding winged helix-turn-helix (wHTH) protein